MNFAQVQSPPISLWDYLPPSFQIGAFWWSLVGGWILGWVIGFAPDAYATGLVKRCAILTMGIEIGIWTVPASVIYGGLSGASGAAFAMVSFDTILVLFKQWAAYLSHKFSPPSVPQEPIEPEPKP